MSTELDRIAELLQARSGIRVRSAQHGALEAAAKQELGTTSPQALLARLLDDDGESLDRLIDTYTIKETFFLRDAGQLREIDWHALLRSARARGSETVNVWSAACATGEEPYTLAMLAAQAFGSLDPPVRIIGTDISRAALAVAVRACYRGRSVRNIGLGAAAAAFEQVDGALTPAPALRRIVGFARHNLARDAAPPPGAPFDLVVCRNVLIYFEQVAVDHAAAVMRRALAPEGVLVLGAADRLCLSRHDRAATGKGRTSAANAERRRARPAPRRSRRGLPARPAPPAPAPPTPTVAEAMARADAGDLEGAVELAERVTRAEPMNAGALYVHGLALLAAGDASGAVRSLRAAQYADPGFAVAAFALGRAHDALDEPAAARRAYEQALRSFDPDRPGDPDLLGAIDVSDVAAACRRRLAVLRGEQ